MIPPGPMTALRTALPFDSLEIPVVGSVSSVLIEAYT